MTNSGEIELLRSALHRAYHQLVIDHPSKAKEIIASALDEQLASKPGPTGKFPRGKVRPDDEGELAVAISVQGDNVFIDFGTSVKWLSLPKADAIRLAVALLKEAGVAKEVCEAIEKAVG